ncbi:unnamed protein product [Euphydryas editha]|uniref:Transposase n=1 Tax=Euphydryas editha TaxID=104508 RepID=A0AAU9UI61_EUPED|nr:unnamed protein product [Euphydryas editha]
MTWKRASSRTPKKLSVKCGWKGHDVGFWEAEGIIILKYLEKGPTITGSHYANQIRELRESIKEKRRGKLRAGVLFHKDNEFAHKAEVAIAITQETGFKLLEHPPYSLYLDNDIYVFSPLK